MNRTIRTFPLALGLLLAFARIALAADEAPEQAAFDVLEYRVLGNTVLPPKAVEAAVYPHLGPGKHMDDVQRARAALEDAYRGAGYGTVFVDIPEQSVDEGIVRLKVTEGKLRQVRVEGARYFSNRWIRAELPSAVQGTVPQLPALQEQIAAANLLTSDMSLVPVLGPGKIPGTVDLTLKVKDELPFHGSLEVNDQYTADTTPLRLLAAVSYDNLFQRLDSLSLQYQTAPSERKQVDVLALGYTARLNDEGSRLALYYVDSNSDVAAVGTLNVLGKGKVYGARFTVPMENTVEASHTLSFGVDYKDFLENINLDPTKLTDPTQAKLQTPISYSVLSFGNSSAWRGERQQWTLSTTGNLGIRGLGNSDEEFANKRFKGRPNFFYLRGDATSRTRLFSDASLLVSLSGQYAVDPVISNEQFALGGASGPRGYLEAEELGDLGVKASLELDSPTWRWLADRGRLQGFMFVDYGRVSTINPLEGEDSNVYLASYGLGFNVGFTSWISGSLTWASPLVNGTRTLNGFRTREGDSRLLFVVRSAW
ncbi:MAG: ShlB/FhaC/HecB family hemolysin secretion/activation protein [Gammaproteobacteria bacterium]